MTDWRMDPEFSGGGHLLNVGTHVIDAILWTTGLTATRKATSISTTTRNCSTNNPPSSSNSNAERSRTSPTRASSRGPANTFTSGTTRCGVLRGTRVGRANVVHHRRRRSRTRPVPRRAGSKADAFVESIANGTEPPSTARGAFWATGHAGGLRVRSTKRTHRTDGLVSVPHRDAALRGRNISRSRPKDK